jgi:hypothetical protein
VPPVAYFTCERYEAMPQSKIDELDAFYVQLQTEAKRVADAMKRIPLQFLRGFELDVRVCSDFMCDCLRDFYLHHSSFTYFSSFPSFFSHLY